MECPREPTTEPCATPRHGDAQKSAGLLLSWPTLSVVPPRSLREQPPGKKPAPGRRDARPGGAPPAIEVECCSGVDNRVYFQSPCGTCYRSTRPVCGYVHLRNAKMGGDDFFAYAPSGRLLLRGTLARKEWGYVVCMVGHRELGQLLAPEGRPAMVQCAPVTAAGPLITNVYTTGCGYNAAAILYGTLAHSGSAPGRCWAVNMNTDVAFVDEWPLGVEEKKLGTWGEPGIVPLPCAPAGEAGRPTVELDGRRPVYFVAPSGDAYDLCFGRDRRPRGYVRVLAPEVAGLQDTYVFSPDMQLVFLAHWHDSQPGYVRVKVGDRDLEEIRKKFPACGVRKVRSGGPSLVRRNRPGEPPRARPVRLEMESDEDSRFFFRLLQGHLAWAAQGGEPGADPRVVRTAPLRLRGFIKLGEP